MGKGDLRYALACGLGAFLSVGLTVWLLGEFGIFAARNWIPLRHHSQAALAVRTLAVVAALAGGAAGFWRQYHRGATPLNAPSTSRAESRERV